MEGQELDFDVSGEIIAVIKEHRANTATMAREIVKLRDELKTLKRNISKADEYVNLIEGEYAKFGGPSRPWSELSRTHKLYQIAVPDHECGVR
jgi:hypothetical protein